MKRHSLWSIVVSFCVTMLNPLIATSAIGDLTLRALIGEAVVESGSHTYPVLWSSEASPRCRRPWCG